MMKLFEGTVNSMIQWVGKDDPDKAKLTAYKTVVKNVPIFRAIDAQMEGPVWESRQRSARRGGKASEYFQ